VNLHNRMFNLRCEVPPMVVDDQAYKLGHRDARHAAAELALSADEQIRKLREALTATADMLGSACHFVSKNNGLMQMLEQVERARAALKEES
jgi:hypothetical protein